MSGPIVFISHSRVKPGKLAEFQQLYHSVVEWVQAEKPGTLLHLAFASKDGSEVSMIHVIQDAEAMDVHIQGASENARKAGELIEIKSWELYGQPSEAAVAQVRKMLAPLGVEIDWQPRHLDGYLRFQQRFTGRLKSSLPAVLKLFCSW